METSCSCHQETLGSSLCLQLDFHKMKGLNEVICKANIHWTLLDPIPLFYSMYFFVCFLLKIFYLFYFNWGLITVLWWFLPYTDMNQPRVYMCPHPEPPSRLPPHPIPLGHPSAPAPSTLSHASNLVWWSISYMIIYMFQYSMYF